jgi:hypothetical protein
MSDIIAALEEIERELSQQKGPFTLFAAFERQDIPSRWDVLVAAPWIERDNEQALRLLAAEIKKRLPPAEMVRVSRIVILSPDDASVRAITSARSVEHSRTPFNEASDLGLPAERGFLITSRPAA